MAQDSIKLFTAQHSETLPFLDAIERLKKSPFGVFLSFVDPRTDTYIQKLFPFFYKPHNTYGATGNCFITEWEGLAIYVPADIRWLTGDSFTSRPVKDRKVFPQMHGIVSGGEYVNYNINVEVGNAIRIDVLFDPVFRSLLSRSGHEHLVDGSNQ